MIKAILYSTLILVTVASVSFALLIEPLIKLNARQTEEQPISDRAKTLEIADKAKTLELIKQ